jgi:hypothetical protein
LYIHALSSEFYVRLAPPERHDLNEIRRIIMKQSITFRQVCLTTLFSGLLLCGSTVNAKEWKSITIATEGVMNLEPDAAGRQAQRLRTRTDGQSLPAHGH